MTHEEEEQALSILASNKDRRALCDAADYTVSNEDPDGGGFHGAQDAIAAGLRGSTRQIWALQDYKPGTTEAEFDTGCFYFFIGDSYDEVKTKIEKLPSLLTTDEFEVLANKLRKTTTPDVIEIRCSDELRREIVVVLPNKPADLRGRPTHIDNVRITYQLQMTSKPKPKVKREKK